MKLDTGPATHAAALSPGRRRLIYGGVAAAAAATGVGLAWWRHPPAPALPPEQAALWGLTFQTPGGQSLPMQRFAGKPLLLNFWATWCPPCRAEHPNLNAMAANGIRIVGVNIRDDDAKATAYLNEEGNPFIGVVSDPTGRRSIDWGVTAPPETFIIGGDGTVLFKFIGPLVGSDYQQRFMPELEKALGKTE